MAAGDDNGAARATRVVVNGDGGVRLRWGAVEKIIVSAAGTLLVAAVIGIIGMHVRLSVVESKADGNTRRMDRIESRVDVITGYRGTIP